MMSTATDLTELQTALDELGRRLEVDLTLDEDLSCYVDVREDLALSLLAGTPAGFVVAGNLLVCQDLAPAELSDILAEFNWLGYMTRGTTLAFNPEQGAFVLWLAQPVEGISAQAIQTQIEQLVQAALEVRMALAARIEDAGSEADPQDQPEAPAFQAFFKRV